MAYGPKPKKSKKDSSAWDYVKYGTGATTLSYYTQTEAASAVLKVEDLYKAAGIDPPVAAKPGPVPGTKKCWDCGSIAATPDIPNKTYVCSKCGWTKSWHEMYGWDKINHWTYKELNNKHNEWLNKPTPPPPDVVAKMQGKSLTELFAGVQTYDKKLDLLLAKKQDLEVPALPEIQYMTTARFINGPCAGDTVEYPNVKPQKYLKIPTNKKIGNTPAGVKQNEYGLFSVDSTYSEEEPAYYTYKMHRQTEIKKTTAGGSYIDNILIIADYFLVEGVKPKKVYINLEQFKVVMDAPDPKEAPPKVGWPGPPLPTPQEVSHALKKFSMHGYADNLGGIPTSGWNLEQKQYHTGGQTHPAWKHSDMGYYWPAEALAYVGVYVGPWEGFEP